ncbi:MAG: hypothetical protein WBK63_08315, partial [Bacillota bacterium]
VPPWLIYNSNEIRSIEYGTCSTRVAFASSPADTSDTPFPVTEEAAVEAYYSASLAGTPDSA